MEYKDYYKLLGVGKDAGQDEIGKAFKKLARKYHFDLNPNNHFKSRTLESGSEAEKNRLKRTSDTR